MELPSLIGCFGLRFSRRKWGNKLLLLVCISSSQVIPGSQNMLEKETYTMQQGQELTQGKNVNYGSSSARCNYCPSTYTSMRASNKQFNDGFDAHDSRTSLPSL
jgi:hypothetical protein